MARPATGREFIEAAKEQIAAAKTADALRAAQALLLPLEFGLSLEKAATAIGLSNAKRGQVLTRKKGSSLDTTVSGKLICAHGPTP